MANIYGILTTERGSKTVQSTRCATNWLEAEIKTWHTVVSTRITDDGNVVIEVTRDGKSIHRFTLDDENVNGLMV